MLICHPSKVFIPVLTLFLIVAKECTLQMHALLLFLNELVANPCFARNVWGAQRSHCSRQSAHVEDQQSTVRGSAVNSEAIDNQQSTVRGSMVNSEVTNNQQSTVRGSTVNSEAIDDQQSTVRGSTVNSEAIDDQQSTVLIINHLTVDH